MLFEVKYGIAMTASAITVDPLLATNFDVVLGGLWIGYYNSTRFHAELPAGHTGVRTFTVTRFVPGDYVVSPSSGNPAPFTAAVGQDGVLTFTIPVAPGCYVDVAPAA
jgi:hypothetical protein